MTGTKKSFPAIVLILVLVATMGSAAAQDRVVVYGVDFRSESTLTEVTLSLQDRVAYRIGRLSAPARIYFDLDNTVLGAGLPTLIPVADPRLKRIRIAQNHPSRVRVVLDLDSLVTDSVSLLEAPARLVVELRSPQLEIARQSPEPPPAPQPEPATAEQVEKLLKRIEELEETVASLRLSKESHSLRMEEGQVKISAIEEDVLRLTQETAKTQAELEGTHQRLLEQRISTIDAQPVYPNLRIRGYADFLFAATDREDATTGFQAGQFVLHFTSPLSPNITFFAETALTARSPRLGTIDPGSGFGFNASVERAFVRLRHNNYLRLSFGRFHTPINWWNSTFHHGSWLQTSIDRPAMTQFGTTFLPVHLTGALLEGTVPASGLSLSYSAAIGNGRSANIAEPGDGGDINNNRAWLINASLRPDRLLGLQVGASLYRDRIDLPDRAGIAPNGGRRFREWISSAHLAWTKERPEILAEFANVRHREDGGGPTYNSAAFYVQGAYRLPWFDDIIKAYIRYEDQHLHEEDPIFRFAREADRYLNEEDPVFRGGLERYVAGLRFDVSLHAAFKAEYRFERDPLGTNVRGLFFQVSYTF